MEVTRLNFKESLPIVANAIEDSSFIAVDAEFSGLNSCRRENALDTCDERYQKLLKSIKDFTVMQIGVCTFTWDDEQQQYIAKPFNFYVFPKPYNRQMPDMRFLCQSSSLDFLAGQGFDFNKWVYHGIPFLLPSDEDKLRRMVSANHDQAVHNGASSTPGSEEKVVPIPPAFEKTIELIMQKVEKFVKDPEQKSLSLPPSSPLLRKLVYSSAKAVHKTGLHLESKKNDDNEKFIMITKCSEEEKKDLVKEKFDQEQEDIEQAVGFAKVMRLLSQSGKVILGHNMLLDLLHMIRLFVSPLPGNLEDFKALTKGVLPRLLDTKVIASTEPLQSHFPISHLQEVYKKCAEAPFVKPNVLLADGFENYSPDTNKAHEAGFDAYMTGVAFVAMASFLEKKRDGSAPCGEMDFDIIKPFLNKIFLFPRMEDIPYLNLDGKDLIPSRDHVFHINHPDTWQFSDIQTLFKEFGYVYISKVDRISSFVSLAKRERAKKVMQKLRKKDVPYRIQTFNEYHGNDGVDGKDDENNDSSTQSPSIETTPKTPCKRPRKDVEEGEMGFEEDVTVEEGELPDSPGPAKKKLKGEHTFFTEPDEW